MDHESSPKGWLTRPLRLGRFNFVISRDDLWVGFYWGRDDGCLYFCPFPMLVFGVQLRSKKCGDRGCNDITGHSGMCSYIPYRDEE